MNHGYHLIIVLSFLLPCMLKPAATAAIRGVSFHVTSKELAMRERNVPLANEVSVKDGKMTVLSKDVCEVVTQALLHRPESVVGAQAVTNDEGDTFASPVAAIAECQSEGCFFKQNTASLRAQIADKVREVMSELKESSKDLVYARFGCSDLFSVLLDVVHLLQCPGKPGCMNKIRIILIDKKLEKYCNLMNCLRAKHKKNFTFVETANMNEKSKKWFVQKGIACFHDGLVQLMKFLYSQRFHSISSNASWQKIELYLCSDKSSYINEISIDDREQRASRLIDFARIPWKAQVLVIEAHVHNRILEREENDEVLYILENSASMMRLPCMGMCCKVTDETATYSAVTYKKSENSFGSVEKVGCSFQMSEKDGEFEWQEQVE